MLYKVLIKGDCFIDYQTMAILRTPRLLLQRTTMEDLIKLNPSAKDELTKCKLVTFKVEAYGQVW